MTRTVETDRGYAVINRDGKPVTTASHLDIAQGYVARAGGDLTVVSYVQTITYEPIAERAAA
jgi:hypothetical protein|tara:strand:- start:859 stop:1044 length:186 start_codon:yes stop_codon:yes gene_type:complete